MIVVFETQPAHQIVHLDANRIAAVVGNRVITDVPDLVLEVVEGDRDRVMQAFREAVAVRDDPLLRLEAKAGK